MYKPFLKVSGNIIEQDYTGSTASKELVSIVYKSIRVFAHSKHSNIEIDRDKLSTIVMDLLNNKKRAIAFNGKRYDIRDVVYAYIKEHPHIDANVNMEMINIFYEKELKPLINKGYDNNVIAQLLNEFIIVNDFPIYLLLNEIDKEAAKKASLLILTTLNMIVQQLMEQIIEERK